MKRFLIYTYILISSVIITAIGYDYFLKQGHVKDAVSLGTEGASVLGAAKISVFKDKNVPLYERPVRMMIESLGMDVPVIEVGVEEDGTMEAPKDWFDAGWYRNSAHAGEPGNMVIAGHYDTSSGSPAAFWQLKSIKKDDTVVVFDKLDRSYTYRVTDIIYIDINDPNKLKIFESNKDKSSITLITCSGVWLSGDLTYSKRLVVKGELIS
ncbi:MAG: Peptidase C60 sortase A and B [candidate division WWE3 bacterium GW2011_GWA1_41_8]|uniref:Peptidase C60 sortase A and B n=3 Tax=Katanobacteria TaxID=422282 RepID=A0A0G0XAE5_UNCKA|nr:MAG: Peptidase C60 sortase A and B [candidate division WWE3 bacterium GW2011_GWB1_41_6]KKS21915.1 MAG: Peptidase C60 sortase A and B [candidate division WWE3 bacterium GW2011_GWA1_41_8]OGC57413.1 MAG: hypothetical protein A2976_04345 [candidate division WWE3 bacterium RIFCSPLOWO2_01_FULL_41_9]